MRPRRRILFAIFAATGRKREREHEPGEARAMRSELPWRREQQCSFQHLNLLVVWEDVEPNKPARSGTGRTRHDTGAIRRVASLVSPQSPCCEGTGRLSGNLEQVDLVLGVGAWCRRHLRHLWGAPDQRGPLPSRMPGRCTGLSCLASSANRPAGTCVSRIDPLSWTPLS